MHIKKILVIVTLLATGLLVAGCNTKEDNNKLNVVTTVYPSYDFISEIADSEVNIELLMKPGTDFHTFDPTPQDIITIEESDVFVYIGTEVWAQTIIDGIDTTKVKVIRLMDYVELEKELVVEGMEHDHDHNHETEDTHDHDHEAEEIHDHDHEVETEVTHDHDHESEETHEHTYHDHSINGDLTQSELLAYDEHIWTSIDNSIEIVKVLTDVLVEVDNANEELYKSNSEKYITKLEDLDEKFEVMINEAKRNYIIVADKFPFTYFVNDYGIDISAAFTGCSSSDEASSQTIAYLIDKVNDNDIPVVFHVESSSEKVADAIVNETDTKKLELHSSHNITLEEFENEESYLDFMESNYNNLKEALN